MPCWKGHCLEDETDVMCQNSIEQSVTYIWCFSVIEIPVREGVAWYSANSASWSGTCPRRAAHRKTSFEMTPVSDCIANAGCDRKAKLLKQLWASIWEVIA